MFSIIIPTFNNLEYLKLCLLSLKKNSNFKNEIIVHINDGSDGSLQYIKENYINYSHSLNNFCKIKQNYNYSSINIRDLVC